MTDKPALCPGPENARLCDNPGCRHGGCQGRAPERKAMPAALAMLLAIPILGALAILGRINSSPQPRRSRRYAAIGAMKVPRAPQSRTVLGWAL